MIVSKTVASGETTQNLKRREYKVQDNEIKNNVSVSSIRSSEGQITDR